MHALANIKEMPPPYHVGQLSTSDVNKGVDTLAQQAGYPQQTAPGYPSPGAYERLVAQSISLQDHTTQVSYYAI